MPPGFEPENLTPSPAANAPASGLPLPSSAPPVSSAPPGFAALPSEPGLPVPMPAAGAVGTAAVTAVPAAVTAVPAAVAAVPAAAAAGVPHGSPTPAGAAAAYQPSGLTAADLQWGTRDPRRRGVWRIVGAVAAALVLLAGAAAGGWYARGSDSPAPQAPPSVAVASAKDIQKALTGDGFQCAQAFAGPPAVDLCFRDSAEYREIVGFQKLDAERASWLKLRVQSTSPGRRPVRQRALRLFGSVIDKAVPEQDARAAKRWLAGMPEDYTGTGYMIHEAGGVRLQLLPRGTEYALLWVRLTGAVYQQAGKPALPALTPSRFAEQHRAAGYRCRVGQRRVLCEKQVDAGTVSVSAQSSNGQVLSVRLTATAAGEQTRLAGEARERAVAVLAMSLTGADLDRARAWMEGAFASEPRHTVLSGLEMRVAPGQGPASYEVEIRPASW